MKIMQRSAKKKWRIEKNLSCKTSGNWRIVRATTEESYDCVLDDGPNSGFTEQSKVLVRCKRILRSWIREQLWSDTRSWSSLFHFRVPDSCRAAILDCRVIHWMVRVWQETFSERWLAQEGQPSAIFHISITGNVFWTMTCSRRTTLCNLPHFKDFGIFSSGIGNRWMRVFNHTTSKVEVVCPIILVELILTVIWWIIGEFSLWNGILENSLTLWNFKAGKSTSELGFVCDQPIFQIIVHWIKEVEVAKSVDKPVTSRSITGQPNFPDVDLHHAMIASALKKHLGTQSNFRIRESVEEQQLRIPTNSFEED